MADKQDTPTVQDSSGTFGELKTMVTEYAKQQTVEPLKNLVKWAGLGIAGGVMMTVGAFLLGLGALRLFQKWDSLDGNLSFAPYAFVFILLVFAAALCGVAATRTPDWMDDDA